MSQAYEVVFYGNLIEGFTKEVTQKHVAQLFKTNIEQVERMFTGNRVVIKNKLDFETAQKYIVAMTKRGAECQIEQMGQPGVSVDSIASSADDTSSSVDNTAPSITPAHQGHTQPSVHANNSSASSSTSSENSQNDNNSLKSTFNSGAHAQPSVEVESKTGLNLVGEKADEILAGVHLVIDPVGVRLSEETTVNAPEFSGIDQLSLAPAGSDLADKKEEVPISVPDVSHLSVE